MIPDELLTELVEVLDEELERMATLRFRLIVLGSLMAADQTPWLERSIRDLEVASEQLRLADLRRAAATVGLLHEYDLEDEARLEEIAERADHAWGELLRERRLQPPRGDGRRVTSRRHCRRGRRKPDRPRAGGADLPPQRHDIRLPATSWRDGAVGAGVHVSDFGLSIAASGLIADTAELDTASNNLANINTAGYAREMVNLSPEDAAGPLGVGRGVSIGSVSELTDAVYEARQRGGRRRARERPTRPTRS